LGFFVIGGIVAGLLTGNMFRSDSLDAIVVLALFLMLYPAMLDVNFIRIRKAVVEPGLVITALVLNFLVSPLLMLGLSHLLLRDSDLSLLVGVTLYSVVPCGGMVPAFTAMVRGNVSLSVAITTISLILSLGFVPLWAKIMIGNQMPFPAWLILKHLFVIIVIPLIVAMLTRRIIVARKGETTFYLVKEYVKILSSVGLMLIMFAMSALHGARIIHDPYIILKIAAPVSVFLMILFLLSGVIGRVFRSKYEDAVALTLGSTPKNNAISMALAFLSFGANVALVNAIAGPLVQLPIMLGFVALNRR
jgi:ACR3 family arsenite transporter